MNSNILFLFAIIVTVVIICVFIGVAIFTKDTIPLFYGAMVFVFVVGMSFLLMRTDEFCDDLTDLYNTYEQNISSAETIIETENK